MTDLEIGVLEVFAEAQRCVPATRNARLRWAKELGRWRVRNARLLTHKKSSVLREREEQRRIRRAHVPWVEPTPLQPTDVCACGRGFFFGHVLRLHQKRCAAAKPEAAE